MGGDDGGDILIPEILNAKQEPGSLGEQSSNAKFLFGHNLSLFPR